MKGKKKKGRKERKEENGVMGMDEREKKLYFL